MSDRARAVRLGRDGVAGAVLLAASVVLFALTIGLKESSLVPIGPGFYPRIVLGISALLGLALLIGDLLAPRSPAAAPLPAQGLNYALVVASFAIFGLYVVALPYLGFRIATLAYVAASSALLAPPRNAKSWVRMPLLAVVTAFAAHLIFERYLSVLLPRGKWTGF